jgi:hypothetical protein
MRCHRTDLNKVYALKDLTPTWIEVEDISGASGLAPRATVLATSRNFSVTGDVATAANVAFNGSGDVALNVSLATQAGLTPGSYSKVTVNAKGLVTGAVSLVGSDLPADLTPATVRLTSGYAVSLASTGHALQIGADGAGNLVADQNDIQARNAGAASTLGINALGGNVTLGNAASTITVAGTLNVTTALALPANSVLTADINALAVTTAKIADGAVTASKLAAGAAGADSANLAHGGVGSYLFAITTNGAAVDGGVTVAGSTLRRAGISFGQSGATNNQSGSSFTNGYQTGTSYAGTWRSMGYAFGATAGSNGNFSTSMTLWLRIA